MADFTERFVPTADGLTIFLRDYEPVQPVTGLPVLCLHGLTRNSKDFEPIAGRIAALGRRVLAMDVRGRGRSDYDSQPLRYTPATYAGDVIAALNRLGVPRAVFIGTSMGGLITLIVAAVEKARVAGVVLNDVGPILNPAALMRIAGYVGKIDPQPNWASAAAVTKSTYDASYPDRDDAFWATIVRRTWKQLPDGRIGLDYDPAIATVFTQPQGAAPPDLMGLFTQGFGPVPTLLVRGALSDLVLQDAVVAMRQAKPDLETVDVPNVGHAPVLDEPIAWEALIQFLAKVP
jgi:pimeloyl-ACP methyl ester carboxylesterase